ncbi:MAG: hypothetical protein R6X14_09505 [bacterium]
MKYFAVCLFTAAVAAANPLIVTVLNEVGITDDTLHWFELHFLPYWTPVDLAGTTVETSTTVCTLDCELEREEYLVVNSTDIARGLNGRGGFRVRPDTDFVRVSFPERLGLPDQELAWPRFPTGFSKAPALPSRGSIALWSYFPGWWQFGNWYVDSTPTPGELNDDHSTITGTVTRTGGGQWWDGGVHISGRYGAGWVDTEGDYALSGLGPGRYRVYAEAYTDSGYRRIVWPESVAVGYADTVTGIDFHFDFSGIAEPVPTAPRPARLNVAGRVVRVQQAAAGRVRLDVIDATGRRAAVLHDAMLAAGTHRFELPSRLGAGIYVIRLRQAGAVTSARAVVVR